jgi:hypothetical protein
MAPEVRGNTYFVDPSFSEGSRELEAICIAWVKIGAARGAWDHGFKLLVG